MKKFISFRTAANICIFGFSLFILFHTAVILGILVFDFAPVEHLWGGQMETAEQLLTFEIVSLAIQALCLLLVLIKTERIKLPRLALAADIGMWLLFGLYTLNTLGNITAKSAFEKTMTVATVLFAVSTLRLALEKREKKTA